MPYPNYHSGRVHDPGKYDKFANKEIADGIQAIYGIKNGKSEIQAYRFDKDKFTADEARKWLKDHDIKVISFEPATGKREAEGYPGMRGITFSPGPDSGIQVRPEGTGVVIEGVTLLSPGIWVDSAVGTPLRYTEEKLKEYADNWEDDRLWSVHSGGIPRPITTWVGNIRNPRVEDGNLVGDLYFHLLTDESRNTYALVKAGLDGELPPVSFSVEHEGTEIYDPSAGCYEAASFTFLGGAIVDIGASGGTKIMEAPEIGVRYLSRYNPKDEQQNDMNQDVENMDEKELMDKLASLEERLAALENATGGGQKDMQDGGSATVPEEKVKAVAEETAKGVAEQAATEAVDEKVKAEVQPLADKVDEIEKKVAELAKKPAAGRTLSAGKTEADDLIIIPSVRVERGTVIGA